MSRSIGRSICTKRGCEKPQSRFGLCAKHDYQINKAYHRTRAKKNYPRYRKKIILRALERYNEKKVDILKAQRDKRKANPKVARKKANAYYAKNKVHLAAEEKKRYHKNSEKKCAQSKEYYKKNKKKRLRQIKKYRKANPDVQRRSWEKRYARESYAFEVTSDAYRYMIMSWKGILMKRDEKKCVYCGAKGKKAKLEAHHIIYKRTEIKLALKENNGCILCRKCHVELHQLNPIPYRKRVKKITE